MKKILFSILMLCCMTAAWAGPVGDGSYTAATMKELTDAINSQLSEGTSTARITLTADIYMSDLGEDEPGRHTLCSTFSGTLDGNGHTIWAARPEVQHDGGGHYHRQYLFTYCDGATIKNVTFKDFRVQSEDNYNQAIITSQAKNKCVFDNITLDHVSVFCNKDNVGAVTGYATNNCTFTNITVRNSDFTTDMTQSGAVVGHAMNNCTFTNIKVENCESTSDDGKSGGVAGRTDNCTISNVEILGCFIKSYEIEAGGITGKSVKSHYSNCIIDDQSCVYAYHPGLGSGWHSRLGGIVGNSDLDVIENCINSALICGDGEDVGGIVGYVEHDDDGGEITIENCLNTGMIIAMKIDDVKGDNGYYSKYKNKKLPCVTKYYNGKEYIVRKTDINYTSLYSYYGGILGRTHTCTISKCANIGSMSDHGIGSMGGDHGDKTGGIVGWCRNATLSDCLSAFESPTDNIKGFIGVVYIEGCKITNCMSTKTAKDYKEESGTTFVVNNVFSRTRGNLTDVKLASGEICHLLGANWEQNIGTDSYPTPTGNKGVYHTRTVSNQYGTACFPFAVKSDDKISYYSLSRKEEDGQGIKLVFTYNEDNILEGTPLLFRSAEAKDADADNPVEICFNNAGEEFTTIPRNKILDAGFWDLWGTFEQRVFEGDLAKHIYYVSGGEIRNAKKATIAPYRAWIYGESIDDLIGSDSSQARIRFVIEEKDGSTADIELVGADLKPVQKNSKTYSLMGTMVNDSYRGIVIKNGKKIKR